MNTCGAFWFNQSDANFNCIFLFDKSIKGFSTYVGKPYLVILKPLISSGIDCQWVIPVLWCVLEQFISVNCPRYSLVISYMYLYTKSIYLFILLNQFFDRKWILPFTEVLFVEVPFFEVLQFLLSNFSMKLTDLTQIWVLCPAETNNNHYCKNLHLPVSCVRTK